MRNLLGLTLLFLSYPISSQWVQQKVDTTASFRGLAVVNEKIVWASGTGGTVIRTIDGGKTWSVITVPGAEKLDFRDIEAFDANTAYILSIGNGEDSRIYKTTDGGATWKLQFKNDDPKKFFDAIACVDPEECFAVSDPVDGKFAILAFGAGYDWAFERSWQGPESINGEAAFAASGTCLIVIGRDSLLMASGGNRASVYRLRVGRDGNLLSQHFASPIVYGSNGSGIFSIAMADSEHGVIVGGNYEKPDEHVKNLAFTTDGGETWSLGSGLTGYRSGVTYVDRNTLIAVGTNGSDITRDGGKSWSVVGKENLNAVASKGRRATWAVGPEAMVVKLK